MKFKTLLLFSIFVFSFTALTAQGYYFGVKGGLLLGTQKWNAFERDPLIKYHGMAFIESLDETGTFSVFAQAGYHKKGSAIRGRNFINPTNGESYRPSAQEFLFNNVVLTFGGKKKYWLSDTMRGHYMFGLRGDYTVSTNLDEYEEANELNGGLFFPADVFVKNWNYGVMLGGGLEFDLSEFVGALIEFSVNPDFSFQYKQPQINNVRNAYSGVNSSIPERTIRNITFEVTAGFRFLRKIEYID